MSGGPGSTAGRRRGVARRWPRIDREPGDNGGTADVHVKIVAGARPRGRCWTRVCGWTGTGAHSAGRGRVGIGGYGRRMANNDSVLSGDGRGQVVPHVEVCPACGGAMQGRSCKVYCVTAGCELFGRVIENCAGD